MTSIAASAIAIILGIAIFIVLAYKGLSPILAALVAALVVGCTCEGGPLTAIFQTFMTQATTFLSSVLLLIVVGGLLSAILEMTGVTDALANGVMKALGEKSIPIVIFVMTGLLCFLGVGSYQFIVAPLALGLLKKSNLPRNVGLISMMVAFNAVTFCLPGTAVTPNLMPTMVLGTTIYAGAGYGVFAFILATGLGLGYVYYLVSDAKKRQLGFEAAGAAAGGPAGFGPGQGDKQQEKDIPPFWNAIVTMVLLFGLCFVLSSVKTLDATQAVVLAQLIAAAWALITNFKRTVPGARFRQISQGTLSVIPLAVMLGFISGFGAVVQSTAAFNALLGKILTMNVNPYLLTFLGVAILSGCMANGTGAIVMVMNVLAPTLMSSGANLGAVHRIATITASTLDSLPHATNVCVSLQVFGVTHKQEYKKVFLSTVVIPVIYAVLTTVICMIFA